MCSLSVGDGRCVLFPLHAVERKLTAFLVQRSQMSGVMVRPGKLNATLRAVEATQADIKAGAVKDVATDEVVEIANVNNNLQVVLCECRTGPAGSARVLSAAC